MTASVERRLGDGGIEQKGKRTHGHGQQCGDYSGKGEYRGLNGNGDNKNEAINNSIKYVIPKK